MAKCDERKRITAYLSQLLEKHIDPSNDPRVYWAKEVTFDYATEHACRVDYMLFKPKNNTVSGIEKGDFYCYEVKFSIEDFRSKNGHNLIGDFNYYVMPLEVFESIKSELPYWVGVYVPTGDFLASVRPAKRRDRIRPVSEMLLMMWRSSRREIVNERRERNERSKM